MEWIIAGKNTSRCTEIDIVNMGFKFGLISLVTYVFLPFAYFFYFASLSTERQEFNSIVALALGIIGTILIVANTYW